MSDVINKIIRFNCSFFDKLKTFPADDIVDIIEIDIVNKIFLKCYLVPLFPHEFIVFVFLINADRLYSESTWDGSITLKIKFSITVFDVSFVQSLTTIIEKELSSNFDYGSV